jgi:hypothetical protein
MKYETWCPLFPGFYGTCFEYDREEEDIAAYNRDNETDLHYDDFEWNYADFHDRLAHEFTDKLNLALKPYLKCKIKYEHLVSPKQYNFKNDSINIEVSVHLKNLMEVSEDFARAYFKNNYSSHNGFISYHSNKLEDWKNVDYVLEKSEHRVGAWLDCFCRYSFKALTDVDYFSWIESEYWVEYTVK